MARDPNSFPHCPFSRNTVRSRSIVDSEMPTGAPVSPSPIDHRMRFQALGTSPRIMRTLTPDALDLQSNFTWLAGRNLRKGLWLLLAASLLILLMAAVNVGCLILSRAILRVREIAIRAAVGASRGGLVAQAFIESLLLGALGIFAGLAVAAGLLQWFRAANPIELPPGAAISLDTHVLVFTALS